jgi:hypothetical protein
MKTTTRLGQPDPHALPTTACITVFEQLVVTPIGWV